MSELEMDKSYEEMFYGIAQSLIKEGKTERAENTLDELLEYMRSGESVLSDEELAEMVTLVMETKNNLKKNKKKA